MAQAGDTMRAVVLQGLGGVENIKIESVPKPKLAKGELLIRVGAVDINPIEWKIRQGDIPGFMMKASGAAAVWPPRAGPHKQYIFGVDAGGIVEEAPAGSKFKKGDRVVVRKTDFTDGTLAEFTAAKEHDTALVPANVSLVDAVALSLSGLTAAQAFALIKGKAAAKGATLLVNGGSGAIGSTIVQLGVMAGLKVTSTASAAKAERIQSLGAEKVLDYRQVNYEQYAVEQGGFDAIIDTVGNSQAAPDAKMLKKGGVFIRLATDFSFGPMITLMMSRVRRLFGGPHYEMLFSHADGKEIEKLLGYMSEGKLKVFVDRTFTLAESAQAQKLAEEGAKGKVVIIVDPAVV